MPIPGITARQSAGFAGNSYRFRTDRGARCLDRGSAPGHRHHGAYLRGSLGPGEADEAELIGAGPRGAVIDEMAAPEPVTAVPQ
jgi:hypothetical protein